MGRIDDEQDRPLDTADEGFAARWSRRKQTAANASPAAARPSGSTPLAAQPERAATTDADMPSIALLNADSDLSGFFSNGVSEELRRQALRKVFSQPRYNVVDGLDDYADDYTRFRPLGDLVTAGLRRHRQRIAARVEQACDTGSCVTVGADSRAESDGADGEVTG